MRKLKVFVGSSSEAKEIDLIIRNLLEDCGITVIPWTDIFFPGQFGLESLLDISNDIDGALLIATPDDKTWYRGEESLSPRDNILFEFGLFLKSLGRYKTGIIIVEDSEHKLPRVPTDLSGLNFIKLTTSKQATIQRRISNWVKQLHKNSFAKEKLDDSFYLLQENYHKVPEAWKDEIQNYILSPFKQMSIDALRGEFTLSAGQYYNSMISELTKAKKGSVIRAISLLPANVWENDDQQIRYEEQNFAAIKLGAEIKRIFVCTDENSSKISKVINDQVNNDIQVKILSPKAFAEFYSLEDCMIIAHDDNIIKSYLTNQYLGISLKLSGCRLNVNHSTGKELIAVFERAWDIANAPKSIDAIDKVETFSPPGLTMKVHQLATPVISCEEAAKARNVPLMNELKSLIVSTGTGYVIVHVPGDSLVSLKSIKNSLDTSKAILASPDELRNIDLTPGTVCAVLEPVWSMPHLISKRVFSLDFVTTNNGTTTGYFKFKPQVLLKARNFLIGDFEK